MLSKVKVSIVESVVTLDFSEFSIGEDVLQDRVDEIVPVIESALSSDRARFLIDDEEHLRFLPMILAKDMVYQAFLRRAQAEVSGIEDILAGRLTASQMGYPEFEDTSYLDD